MGWVLAVAGAFTIAAAAKDVDWFMNHHKARLFVSMFGRNGARVFYALLGTFIAVIGVMQGLGFLD